MQSRFSEDAVIEETRPTGAPRSATSQNPTCALLYTLHNKSYFTKKLPQPQTETKPQTEDSCKRCNEG